ncbi:MAG: ATP-binding protein, partial [Thermodesulfobacteriota bacterium]
GVTGPPPVRGARAGGRPAALLVLSDVTRLRRLETLRRDFAANVSHEIRTPLSSIRAASETLLSGAMQNPEEAERFASMIGRNAERLEAIVDDLLKLSRLERDDGARARDFEPARVLSVLRAAAAVKEEDARKKEIEVTIACPEGLFAPMNRNLMEQALVNLLDNALQYSPAKGKVRISAEPAEGQITFCVEDQGPGIEARHQERLFERFYRVDPARSRKMGGTGLGLAIVKHIAQAHNGAVWVKSAPGKGASFFLRIPQAPQE